MIELLAAMMIFSLIVGGIYTSFRTAINAWQCTEREAYHHQDIQFALGLLRKELRSAFLPPEGKDFQFKGEDGNDESAVWDKLTFYSRSNSLASAGPPDIGLIRVTYTVTRAEGQANGILRRSEVNCAGEKEFGEDVTVPLMPGVLAFDIKYFYRGVWKDSWHSDKQLPARVKVNLMLAVDHQESKEEVFNIITDIPASNATRFDDMVWEGEW